MKLLGTGDAFTVGRAARATEGRRLSQVDSNAERDSLPWVDGCVQRKLEA
jgi:hypothetical protein